MTVKKVAVQCKEDDCYVEVHCKEMCKLHYNRHRYLVRVPLPRKRTVDLKKVPDLEVCHGLSKYIENRRKKGVPITGRPRPMLAGTKRYAEVGGGQ